MYIGVKSIDLFFNVELSAPCQTFTKGKTSDRVTLTVADITLPSNELREDLICTPLIAEQSIFRIFFQRNNRKKLTVLFIVVSL